MDLTGVFERGSRTEDARQDDIVADERDGVRVTADGLAFARLVALLLDKGSLAGVVRPRHSTAVLIVGRFAPRAAEAALAAAAVVRASGRVPVTIDGGEASAEALAQAMARLGAVATLVVADQGLATTDPAILTAADGVRVHSLSLDDGDGTALAQLMQS